MFHSSTSRANRAGKGIKRKLAAVLAMSALAWWGVEPAFATIDNTVVVSGTAQGNPVSASATENVDVVNQAATLLLVKQGTVNDGGDGTADAGDTISYTFDITNTGNVTLTNVALTDNVASPGAAVLSNDVAPFGDSTDTPAANWAVLAPGDSLHLTATYVLTPADVNAGHVLNAATASATTVPGAPVSTNDTVDTLLNIVSSLSLVKSGTLNLGPNARADVGDLISYTFTVTNTGNTTLNNVRVSDPLVDFASLPGHERVIALMEGAATGVDTMMTASISGLGPVENQPYHWASEGITLSRAIPVEPPQLPVALHATRKLVNLSGHAGALQAGDHVGIYYDVVNTGDVPLTTLTVEQQGAEAFGDTLDILAPNAKDSASIIFTRVLNAEDIAAKSLSEPATLRAKARSREVLASVSQPLMLDQAFSLADLATASILPASVPSLAPGAQTTFTATYPLVQTDIDAGHVANTATASGDHAISGTVSSTSSFDVPVPRAPGVALVKTGVANLGPDNVASVGDTISYSFAVTNTGNTTLTNLTVTDPLVAVTGGPLATLAPAAVNTTTFTAAYTLTQADIDAGQVQNQATVSATPPTGPAITDPSDDTDITGNDPTVTTLAATPKIALVKRITGVTDVNGNGFNDVGDTVAYNFTVTNTGNVTLHAIYVQDRNVAVVTTPAPPTVVTMAPGASDSTTFTAVYTLTQANVDAGFFDNTADAFGTAPDNTIVQDQSDPLVITGNAPTHLVIPAQRAIALVKTVASINDVNGNGITDLNDIITFDFAVSNRGNVTLTNVTVTDPNAIVTGGPLASLLPGTTNTTTFHATHVVSAADMLAGRVSNQATARGTAPGGALVTDLSDFADPTQNRPTLTPVTVRPAIALIKRVTGFTNLNGNGVIDAGDTIEYAFTVANTGNVPLNNIVVTDPLVTVIGGPLATLAAGASDTTTFRASYVLTAADVTAGQVVNQATARGTAPNAAVVTDLSDAENLAENDPTITLIANAPALGLVKTMTSVTDTNANSINDAGDVVHYAFTVTNLGNVPLTNVTLTDPNATVSGGPIAVLNAGASDSATFTATHVVTVADVNAGGVTNQATATAQSTMGPVSDLSDDNSPLEGTPTQTPLTQSPGIALVKTVSSITDSNHNGRTDTGDSVNYAFTVYNTGNVTLTNITISDTNAVMAGGPLASLLPGANNATTFTATHVVTVVDSEAEQITNQAQASGTTPASTLVTDLSDNASATGNNPTVIAVSAPLPVLTKTAARSEVRRGETVAYTITASNLRTGPYNIADIMPPGFALVPGSTLVNGVATAPSESGNTLAFASISPDAQGRITIKLSLLASTSLSTGSFVNRARLYLSTNGDLLAEASATVTIKEEHVFDCGEIIGRVFDDLNGDGYANEGEPGLPGVRVATVKGLLVTTDKFGRFHVSCADVPDATIGSNFLMKLDPRTLPVGYKLTSENPRDVRLTRGKVTKLNFGASRQHDVELAVTRDAFTGSTADLKPKWAAGVDRLVSLLAQGKGKLTIVYRCSQQAPIIQPRLNAVKSLVQSRWDERGNNKPLTITTRVECGG